MKKIKRGLLTLGVRQPLYMPNLLITRIVTGPCSVQRNPLPTNYRRIISGKRRSDTSGDQIKPANILPTSNPISMQSSMSHSALCLCQLIERALLRPYSSSSHLSGRMLCCYPARIFNTGNGCLGTFVYIMHSTAPERITTSTEHWSFLTVRLYCFNFRICITMHCNQFIIH